MNNKIRMRLFSLRASSRKRIALFLIIIFLTNIFYPTVSWALTGGPSQPEVESFEPIGTSQMVDPFSGDFNYNIPLLDIDGYPIQFEGLY